jgi:hypothetical protein
VSSSFFGSGGFFSFFFFSGSGGGGGGIACGGCSSRTDITGTGGGSSQLGRNDQSTPNTRKGTMISMPSAISTARQNGSVCSLTSSGCAHSAPRTGTASGFI